MSSSTENKYVLYAVLNWGLGHATRSIPFIKALQGKGYKLVVCSDGLALKFLKEALSDVTYESLPGYNIHYSYASMALNMVIQSPKIYINYQKEKRVFTQLVKRYKPIFCISDNRYGCRNIAVSSYFVGHQWSILNGKGHKHYIASLINQHYIRKFDKMIIPDDPRHHYTGAMTNDVPVAMRLYAGILSRLEQRDYLQNPIKFDFGIILSGPEPNRSRMESKLLTLFANHIHLRILLIRGSNNALTQAYSENIEVKNVVHASELTTSIDACRCIVSRPGYSSIMDYIQLGVQRMVFIPTKGQTEQEYLARRFYETFKIPFLEEDRMEGLIPLLDNLSEVRFQNHSNSLLSALIDKIESEVLP